MAGEWEVVDQPTSKKVSGEADTTPELPKKREAEEPPDLDDTRSFKLRKRVAPSVTDDWDADLIPIKLKPKKMEVAELTDEVKKEEESSQPTEAAPIKWTSRGWKRREDELDETLNSTTPKDEELVAGPNVVPEPIVAVLEPKPEGELKASLVKVEPPLETVDGTGATFRKRKFLGNRGKR